MTRRWQFGLPLLTKELIEQAGRRRTYLVRITYAALLFVLAYLQIGSLLLRPSGAGVLGSGGTVFATIIELQTLGIYVFMPALACSAITQEKERNSLTMLLITRLSPTTILLEKLLSRLVPMLSFLLLSMPLLGFAYSLGGVTMQELWCNMAILTFLMVQIATFALMCSAFCGTTVSAFFWSYVLGLMLLGPIGFCARAGFLNGTSNVGDTVIYCTISAMSTTFFFVMARAFIVSRAIVAPRNFMLQVFQRLDGLFSSLNQVTTGGIILIHDDTSLPKSEPIAWREVTKKSLGTARYLIRVLLVIEIPMLFVLAITADRSFGTRFRIAAGVLSVVWVISILLISVKSATLVTSERTRQTLDVLLATPMTGPSIMKQYFAGVHRLMMVLYVPFLTIFAFELWWGGFESVWQLVMYVACSGLSILIYCPLIAWISFLIGLKVRSQTRAILLALIVVFGWTFLPILLAPKVAVFGTLMIISPAYAILANEDRSLQFGTLCANFVLYGGILFVIRRNCLALADSFLGRLGEWKSRTSLVS